jgi:hypothetical protein
VVHGDNVDQGRIQPGFKVMPVELGIARRADSSSRSLLRLRVGSSHQPSMTEADRVPQSDGDRLQVVADEAGGCCWQICGGGVCLQDRSRVELMRRWSVREDRERPDEPKVAM